MKPWLAFLLFACVLALPETAAAQTQKQSFVAQVSGGVSAFRYERGQQAQWRTNSNLRLRGIVNSRVFGEVSYSAPIVSDVPFDCLLVGPCNQDFTSWHFSILTGGIGVFILTGEWKPFLGISKGRFETEDEGHGTWMVFSGLERSSKGRLGFFAEYRLGHVDWPSEGGVAVNHEIGVGLTISLTGQKGSGTQEKLGG